MRNTFLLISSLILLLCFFQYGLNSEQVVETPISLESTGSPVLNDSIWQRDSIAMARLWERYWFFDNNNRHDSAIAVCQDMIQIGGPLMEYKYDSMLYEKYCKAYGGVGYNLIAKGQFDEGIKYTKKGSELIAEKFGEYHPRNSEMCTAFTMYYSRKGDFDQALKYCDKSSKIRKKTLSDSHYYVGNIYCNYGITYSEKGDYKSAINYFLMAKRNYEGSGSIFAIEAYRYLCKAYFQIGDFQNSKKYALKGIRFIIDCVNTNKFSTFLPTGANGGISEYFDIAEIYVLLGIAHRGLGEYEESCINIKKGIEIAGQQWDKAGDIEGFGWLELGKTLREMGEYPLAISAYNKVAPTLEKYAGGGFEHNIDAWNEIAEIYTLAGSPDSSVCYFQRSLNAIAPAFSTSNYWQNPSIEKVASSLILLEILIKKAQALHKLYDKNRKEEILDTCLQTYSLAIKLIDKLRYGYKWQDSKQSLSDRAFPIVEEAIKTALEISRFKDRELYLEKTIEFAERNKAFILLEKLESENAKSIANISNDLLQKEEKINKELALYQRLILDERISNQFPDSSKISYWNNKLINLKKSQDSISFIFEEKYPDYFRLKYNDDKISVFEIQKIIPQYETLIEYFLGDTSLYTFTITKNNFNVHQQKIDSNFFQAVDRVRDFSSHHPSEKTWARDHQQFITDSYYLYGILLEPTLAQNSPSTSHHSPLIIIPDGILNFLPFNILLSGMQDEKTMADANYYNLPYLIRDHDIRYEYSATLMVESKRSKPGSFWQKLKKSQPAYCGFAPSYGDGDPIASRGEMDSIKMADLYPGLLRGELAPLTHNRSEVDTASETLGGTPFTGSAATEKTFKQNAPQADILHLAMHALTNDKEPLFSQLAFEKDKTDTLEDGRLHAYELYNMRLKADLAVLSACNTGAGKLQRGEGVMSLSRAFKYAGVPNVVMSLWAASDEPTQKIVGHFFKNLKSGMGKDQALCGAQREFVKHAGQIESHPYYWSTLMLIGDGEPLFGNNVKWPFYTIGLVLIFLIGLFIKRKHK